MPDIRGLISDPEFKSLPAHRKRAILERTGADPGFIGEYLGDSAPQGATPATPPPSPVPRVDEGQVAREAVGNVPTVSLPGTPSVPLGYAIGAAKGAANTVLGLGRMVDRGAQALGLSDGNEAAFKPETWGVQPQTTKEQAGAGAEQVAEFFALPGPGKVKGAAKAVEFLKAAPVAAALAKAQGQGDVAAAVSGVTAGLPVAEWVRGGGRWVGSKAMPLVRSAIKPTVSAMRQVAGASVAGLDQQANNLVGFILENRLTSPEKAGAIIRETERELQRLLSVRNAPTNAPERAVRYLESLERNAAKQGLPTQDVTTIRNAAAEVLQSGLGQDVVTMVPTPHPTLVQANGQPVMVLAPKTTRALRTDVMADEALDRARASSKWDTRKSWGEQKGSQKEAGKAVERALRDSVKDAVPETVPVLGRQGQAIQARQVLDRMAFRQANRDPISLPAWAVAGAEVASGKPPLLGMAANWLRNNEIKAGIYADRISKAIDKGDAPQVAFYLQKLGISVPPQLVMASPK